MARPEATGKASAVERRGFSINEWCTAYGVSRASFYNMRKDGGGPDLLYIRGRPIITVEADKNWAKRNTVPARKVIPVSAQNREEQSAT